MHPHRHHMSRTTHTVEMDQLAALNLALRTPVQGRSVTAADLGLGGAPFLVAPAGAPTLAADAVLDHLCFEGAPQFPYIHAHFRSGSSGAATDIVDLHTQALRELTRLLHLRGTWGTGSSERPPT